MTTPNAELAYRVLDQIHAHPELWRQDMWVGDFDCGTSYCFAGWALALSGHHLAAGDNERGMRLDGEIAVSDDVIEVASAELGIDLDSGARLFEGSNTRARLVRLVSQIFGRRPDAAS